MILKILVDMNLSHEWIPFFERAGWDATHWSVIGDPRAQDAEIMSWAQRNKMTVFTHDLDFGIALAKRTTLHLYALTA